MQQQRSWQSILQKVLGTAPALITAQVATLFYHRENNKFFIFFSLFFLMQGLSSGLLVATKVDVQPF